MNTCCQEGFDVTLTPARVHRKGCAYHRPELQPPASRAASIREHMRQAKESYLQQLIEETGGNLRMAARLAGIARPSFSRLVSQHGLQDRVALARLRAKGGV